jgi:hypothetical protein
MIIIILNKGFTLTTNTKHPQIYFIFHAELEDKLYDAFCSIEHLNQEYGVKFSNWEEAILSIKDFHGDLTIKPRKDFS